MAEKEMAVRPATVEELQELHPRARVDYLEKRAPYWEIFEDDSGRRVIRSKVNWRVYSIDGKLGPWKSDLDAILASHPMATEEGVKEYLDELGMDY